MPCAKVGVACAPAISRTPTCRRGSAGSRGSRTSRSSARFPPTTAATTGWPSWGCARTDFARPSQRARDRYGARRIGVFLGTSTSGILQTELAYRRRDPQRRAARRFRLRADAQHLLRRRLRARDALGLSGPGAWSSPPPARPAPRCSPRRDRHDRGRPDRRGGGRRRRQPVPDDAVRLPLARAHLARAVCRPLDARRDGLSIGEAAASRCSSGRSRHDGRRAAARLRREQRCLPHVARRTRRALGARWRCARALAARGLRPAEIDYINLHGTATPSNDAAEDRRWRRCSAARRRAARPRAGPAIRWAPPASSRPSICVARACAHGFMPGTLNTQRPDPQLSAGLQLETCERSLRAVPSNSFGFGGTNCSLVFGRLG